MQEIILKIKTLTPLWTGGIDGSCDRVHSTGIIGSIRWWYEVTMRGLGHSICDPAENGCEKNICRACEMFGSTGQKRKFILRVDDKTTPAWQNTILNIRPSDRNRGWYLPAGNYGELDLRLLSNDGRTLGTLCKLLLFIERYGALGSRNQLGYGIISIVNRSEIVDQVSKLQRDYFEAQSQDISEPNNDLPRLNQFGFSRYSFSPHKSDWWSRVDGLQRLLGSGKTAVILQNLAKKGMVPVSPVIKNQWRFREWKESQETARHYFGASIGETKIKSKTFVSWAYKSKESWEIRSWHWLPGKGSGHKNSQDVPGKIWTIVNDTRSWNEALNLNSEDSTWLTSLPAGTWKIRGGEDVQKMIAAVTNG